MEDALANYYSLVKKVDDLCRQIESHFSDQLACKAGCSGCCRHITLAMVEAMAIVAAIRKLPANEAEAIRLKAQYAKTDEQCPLLIEDRCALYEHRPIICRTHGLPILTGDGSDRSIDFCPHNFKGLTSMPGHSVIDLDRLNILLDSVNTVFINEFFYTKPEQERLSIAEALLLDLDISGDMT